MKRLIGLLLLSGCVSATPFQQGSLQCIHTVSTKLMGTAQIVSCENGYINSFSGTAGIDPIEKAAQAGAMIGGGYAVLKNLPTVLETNSVIHLRP